MGAAAALLPGMGSAVAADTIARLIPAPIWAVLVSSRKVIDPPLASLGIVHSALARLKAVPTGDASAVMTNPAVVALNKFNPGGSMSRTTTFVAGPGPALARVRVKLSSSPTLLVEEFTLRPSEKSGRSVERN